MNPRLFVVLPLTNHATFLQEVLQALATQTEQGFELRFIDNGMPEAALRRVSEVAPTVATLHNPRNRGWGAAWDQAAQLATARWGMANDAYLCLLSSDTFPSAECFETLQRYMDAHRDVAMVSPVLLHLFEEHGADEALQERVESEQVASAGLVWRWPWRLQNRGVNQPVSDLDSEAMSVDAVAPGCVLVRLSALDSPFDVRLMSSAALVEGARRIKQAGGECHVIPDASAYRYSGRYRSHMPDRVLQEMSARELRRVAWRRWRGTM